MAGDHGSSSWLRGFPGAQSATAEGPGTSSLRRLSACGQVRGGLAADERGSHLFCGAMAVGTRWFLVATVGGRAAGHVFPVLDKSRIANMAPFSLVEVGFPKGGGNRDKATRANGICGPVRVGTAHERGMSRRQMAPPGVCIGPIPMYCTNELRVLVFHSNVTNGTRENPW